MTINHDVKCYKIWQFCLQLLILRVYPTCAVRKRTRKPCFSKEHIWFLTIQKFDLPWVNNMCGDSAPKYHVMACVFNTVPSVSLQSQCVPIVRQIRLSGGNWKGWFLSAVNTCLWWVWGKSRFCQFSCSSTANTHRRAVCLWWVWGRSRFCQFSWNC